MTAFVLYLTLHTGTVLHGGVHPDREACESMMRLAMAVDPSITKGQCLPGSPSGDTAPPNIG